MTLRTIASIALTGFLLAAPAMAQQRQAAPQWATTEGDFIVKNFHFQTGETLPELKIHYTTLGTPQRDKAGHVTNAVMLLHGTGGSGKGFLSAQFGGQLFVPGAPLDITKYYIVMPDAIGHGQSSKPSDGLKAKFPKYDYTDMVNVQHQLLIDKLHVDSLQLILGTSMGCMHAFMWGETWPDMPKRLMPLACAPMEIAGRNRASRRMMMDAVRADPAYNDGNYTEEPVIGLRNAQYILTISGGAPQQMQAAYPTREKADAYADNIGKTPRSDANDFLWQLDSSRTYDPSANLEKIKAKVTWINSADDFINPPELGVGDKFGPRIKNGKFILIPASMETVGHGTHSKAVLWKDKLAELMQ